MTQTYNGPEFEVNKKLVKIAAFSLFPLDTPRTGYPASARPGLKRIFDFSSSSDISELLMTATNPQASIPLHRGNGLPLYQQIQQRLVEQIQSGAYKPSEPLPSIQKIAAQMGVSQMTVRQAVKSLTELGIIYSRQGKGTFLSSAKLEKEFRHVLSFSEEARAHGATPRSRLLSFNIQAPTPETKAALSLADAEMIFRLRRVRFEDSMPIGIECSCLAVSACPSLMETFNPETSLYEKLSSQYGIQLTITEEVIEVGKANAEEARLLQISRQSPVFLFTRVSFREDGRPVEHVKSTYRGDRYKIVNRLMRTRRAVLTSPIGI
jgi:GntR family transcriptional regulator